MLILVVIGIKLAHVDTALKGEKTTSHLLLNLSLFLSQAFFRLEAQGVCTAVCYAVQHNRPGGPCSRGSLPCQEPCTCLGRETHREEFKIYVDATGKGSISSFCKVRGWLGLVGVKFRWDVAVVPSAPLCRETFGGSTGCMRGHPQTT